jgi:dienelactone hydrolase
VGGLEEQEVAALLASRGFVALTLAYFGAEHLPDSLSNIRLEYFDKALDFLQKRSSVQRDRIGILGTSKGAEAGLLVASRNPVPRVVVAYAPSAYVWSCICQGNGQSSWSVHRRPVPFIPFQDDPTYAPPSGFPLRFTVNYLYSLHQQVRVKETTIPVERIKAPIMLISGKDDQLWPSYLMANAIIDRRHRLTKFRDLHLAYANAGHLIGKAILPVGSTVVANGHIQTGGTPYGDAVAQQDSWPKVIEFLRKVLGR